MPDSVFDQDTLLFNGSIAPLGKAIAAYGSLASYNLDPEIYEGLEWDVLFHLRELARGRELPPEILKDLRTVGFVDDDGHLTETMASVVLSSIQGQGRNLQIVSPFTDPVHDTIATFSLTRDKLRAFLEPNEYEQVMAETDPKVIEDEIGERFKQRQERSDQEARDHFQFNQFEIRESFDRHIDDIIAFKKAHEPDFDEEKQKKFREDNWNARLESMRKEMNRLGMDTDDDSTPPPVNQR